VVSGLRGGEYGGPASPRQSHELRALRDRGRCVQWRRSVATFRGRACAVRWGRCRVGLSWS